MFLFVYTEISYLLAILISDMYLDLHFSPVMEKAFLLSLFSTKFHYRKLRSIESVICHLSSCFLELHLDEAKI